MTYLTPVDIQYPYIDKALQLLIADDATPLPKTKQLLIREPKNWPYHLDDGTNIEYDLIDQILGFLEHFDDKKFKDLILGYWLPKIGDRPVYKNKAFRSQDIEDVWTYELQLVDRVINKMCNDLW